MSFASKRVNAKLPRFRHCEEYHPVTFTLIALLSISVSLLSPSVKLASSLTAAASLVNSA